MILIEAAGFFLKGVAIILLIAAAGIIFILIDYVFIIYLRKYIFNRQSIQSYASIFVQCVYLRKICSF